MNSGEKTAKTKTGVRWSVENGALNVALTGERVFALRNLYGSVTVNGKTLFLAEADAIESRAPHDADGQRAIRTIFSFRDPAIRLIRDITESGDGLKIDTVLENKGETNIEIRDWCVLHGKDDFGGGMDLGPAPDQVRFFAWRGWQTHVRRLCEKGPYSSNTLCHLTDHRIDTTLLIAFETLDRMQTRHWFDYDGERGVTEYKAECIFGDYVIRPNTGLRAETLCISCHDDPCGALEAWAEKMYEAYHPSFEGTMDVNWSGNAWIDAFTCEEESWTQILLDNAKAIRDKLGGFGIRYLAAGTHVVIKDGLPGNWLTFENAPGFEGGYPALYEKLESMGFRFKLWFSPFWFLKEAEGALEENRENLLRDKDGVPITDKCSWEFDRHRGPDDEAYLTKYYLDGSHPKTWEYITKIFKAYRAMGGRAYMLDFLAVKSNARMSDDSMLPLAAGRKILQIIRDAAGPEVHLQTAVASSPGFIGCINSARVGRDYGEGRPMHPFHGWYNATYCMHDHHFANTHYFVQNAAASWFTHRKIYVNDLNQMTVDKPVPLEHARITATMFGLNGGSPLNLSDDMRNIDPERLRMIKMCLPRLSGVAVPVDLFDRVYPDDYCRILKLPVVTAWESYMLAAVFNTDKTPYRIELDFVKLGLDADKPYRVHEFWNEEYQGTYKRAFTCDIPPDSCRLYRISEARPHPWLLSTDMHVQQGAAEISDLQWDGGRNVLSGTAVRPRGEYGSLFFIIPRRYKLINHERKNTMKDVRDMMTVIRWPVAFEHDAETFELRFQRIEPKFAARREWLKHATEEAWLAHQAEIRDPADTRVIE